MKYQLLSLWCLLLSQATPLAAQMWNGRDTLFGNEWINYEQNYFKIGIAEDGVYRLTRADLLAAGLPVADIAGDRYQLFRLGREVALHVSSGAAPIGVDDYLEFYGQKNRSELDRFLFRDPDREMLNPHYSLFTDTAAYFLTWAPAGPPTQRYQTVENDLSSPPPREQWFWDTLRLVFGERHFQRRLAADLVSLSRFDEAEGFARAPANMIELSLAPPAPHPSGPSPILRLRLAADRGQHRLSIQLNGQPLLLDTTIQAYAMRDYAFSLGAGLLGQALNLKLEGKVNQNDRYALVWVELVYPRRFSFADSATVALNLPASSQRRYLELENIGGASSTLVAYAPLQGRRWILEKTPQDVTPLLLSGAGQAAKLIITAAPRHAALAPVRWAQFDPRQSDYLLISHQHFIAQGAAEEYAAYRASPQGGAFRPLVVDVQQLYDQFAYGINQHPQALRNFGHWLARQGARPRHVFLVGKGYEYPYTRQDAEGWRARNLVPVFGVPGSDNLLFSNNFTAAPLFPVGRLAARDPGDLRAYLAKVKIHEASFAAERSFDNFAWLKRVLHLVGGNAEEQVFFGSLLNNMANRIAGNAFGAQVATVDKSGSDAVSSSISESVIRAVNEGVAIKTFLGHGAVVNTDFGLDDPELFDNAGRYMLSLSLGCLSGNTYTPQNSVSERFVLHPSRGAIAYIASSGFGYPNALNALASEFYQAIGGNLYGRGIGEAMRAVQQRFGQAGGIPQASLVEQLNLHGDPAVRINDIPAPDFVVDFRSLRLEPQLLSTQSDSFTLAFNLANIGAVGRDSLDILIEHRTPQGVSHLYRHTVLVDRAIQTARLRLPLAGPGLEGLNQLRLRLDPNDRIPEQPLPAAKDNNALRGPNGEDFLSFFIIANEARPVYPPPFAIVNAPDIRLTASAADVFAAPAPFVIELDTSARFDSPALRRAIVVAQRGLVEWTPDIAWRNESVYYWRLRPEAEPSAGETPVWSGSSFIYLPQSETGWNQSHFFQFLENGYEQMLQDTSSRRLVFEERLNSVIAEAMVNSPTNQDRSRCLLNNNRIYLTPAAAAPSFTVIVFDPDSGAPMPNPPGVNHGEVRNNTLTPAFSFLVGTPEQRQNLMNFLDNVAPDGHFVVLFSYYAQANPYNPADWGADSLNFGRNLFQLLEAQGAIAARQLELNGPRPYVFAYKKGEYPLGERIGDEDEERALLLFSVPGRFIEGRQQSTLIGPAGAWRDLEWEHSWPAGIQPDSAALSLYGLSGLGSTPVLLREDIREVRLALEQIDARTFPYLRLQLIARDTLTRQAPQLNYWRVHHQDLPELALSPLEFLRDTLEQGEYISLLLAVRNLSNVPSDSTSLHFTIVDAANQRFDFRQTLRPLGPGDSLHTRFTHSTERLAGDNLLIVRLDNIRAERFLFNNEGVKRFHVRIDQRGPLLDVTFDGVRIMNGDLVSARPNIAILLEDDNPFLRLNDTALVDIFLREPTGQSRRIAFSDERVSFFPAEESKRNRASIVFQPELETSGEYQLSVRARDASGNTAGKYDYRVTFQVITESSISNILPYPNPFSNATRFAYTLTGAEEPAYFLIQIMTVSGRIVREITKEEFGQMRVGRHLSDFVWDGTDQYGDRLANGVYLYRVIVKDQGRENLERFENAAIDRFFKKNMGKIVILR